MATTPLQSLLKNLTSADVVTEPFPHLLIPQALPEELVSRLLATFPSNDVVSGRDDLPSNARYSFGVKNVREEQRINALWKEFINAQSSPEFLADVLRIFKPFILEEYPDFEERFGPIDSMHAGVRKIDQKGKGTLLLDAQICINTPVTDAPTSVKIAHLDKENKLFAGLLYLRSSRDDSEGGELELYRYKKGKRPLFHGPRLIEDSYVEQVARVPYASGNFIFFLNSLDALHGVTPRAKTKHTRRFVNIIIETPEPLFNLAPISEGRLRRFIRRIRGKNHEGNY